MSHQLYQNYKITYKDYEHYNTYFVDDWYDQIHDLDDKLKQIDFLLEHKHEVLSDKNISKIAKSSKKELTFNRRLNLIFGIVCFILLFYALQHLKPKIGLTPTYKMTKVYNNPWDLLLVALIMFASWAYEIKTHKKRLTHKIKNHIIKAVESCNSEYKKLKHQKKKFKRRRRY